MRDGEARRVAAEQRDEDRSFIERDIIGDMHERFADEREQALDERSVGWRT